MNMRRLVWTIATFSVVLVIFGTMYAAVQQAQRSAANEPQIQLAEDYAAKIKRGEPPITLTDYVDIGSSLASFVTIYDKTGRPILSSGFLDGKQPKVPLGVLKAAQGKQYHAVTWEPKDGVRIAAISVATGKDYYVLSGRSLREVEKNETQTLGIAAIGAAFTLVIAGAVALYRLASHQYAREP